MIRHEELRRARRRIEDTPGTPAVPSPDGDKQSK